MRAKWQKLHPHKKYQVDFIYKRSLFVISSHHIYINSSLILILFYTKYNDGKYKKAVRLIRYNHRAVTKEHKPQKKYLEYLFRFINLFETDLINAFCL